MVEAYFIFYVADQARGAAYYRAVLDVEPILDVPGITEFRLFDGAVLAVMPAASARRLLGDVVPSADEMSMRPKAELYLVVDDPEAHHARALANGGTELSPMQARDWNHRAAYSLDPDGHVVAFAEKTGTAG